MGLVQKEVQKVYMWKEPISMDKGPCADGFHIPTKDEATALVDAMTTLGKSNASDWRSLLKMPASGKISTSGVIGDTSDYSFCWTTTALGDTFPDSHYIIYVRNGYGVSGPTNGYSAANGCSIRPFKDVPVTPDSSWTALYSNRIYWNATLGLISVSSDGTNWITIADKNAGAENVNDTGSYYQRGNNYGFPSSGFTTSSTQVDTSDYGSTGVAYSSSTFITGQRDWRTSTNDSLWDYTVGGDILIRPARKDVYADFLLVGGGGGGGGTGDREYSAGGGGAGGYIECCEYELQAGSYPITIGAGGAGGYQYTNPTHGCNGGNSTFNGLTAYGGGGGACYRCYTSAVGCSGGSGGGGGPLCSCPGGAGCSEQGNNGGTGGVSGGTGGGGGGGAGAAGGNSSGSYYGGAGGNGKSNDISGTSVWYAGGGGGGSRRCCTHGAGGCGGGTLDATCYGGGGGGGQQCCKYCSCSSLYGHGYAGKQGIFILRYPTACGYTVSGGCCYTCGDYTIHCFTSNGTLTVN